MLANLREGRVGLGARGFQALAQLALVADLLFDARELAADAVALGLHRAQLLAGLVLLHAAGLDLRLGGALLGEDLLQLQFVLRQQLAQRRQLGVELAVLERLQLRVLVEAFGLDRWYC